MNSREDNHKIYKNVVLLALLWKDASIPFCKVSNKNIISLEDFLYNLLLFMFAKSFPKKHPIQSMYSNSFRRKTQVFRGRFVFPCSSVVIASDAERSEASFAVDSLLLRSHMVTRNKKQQRISRLVLILATQFTEQKSLFSCIEPTSVMNRPGPTRP